MFLQVARSFLLIPFERANLFEWTLRLVCGHLEVSLPIFAHIRILSKITPLEAASPSSIARIALEISSYDIVDC